jgi:hypothetical protein
MVDRVQVIKWESPSQGGTQEDTVPSEINPNEDGLSARAYFVQDDSSADNTVGISRDSAGNLLLFDPLSGGTYTLGELLGGGFDVNKILVNQDGAVLTNQDGNVLMSG